MTEPSLLAKAAEKILTSNFTAAFTGAGISVESGIPPFRGEKGLWNKYDPRTLEINYFYSHPLESWKVIMEIFYEFFGRAEPNDAHKVLAQFEKKGLLQAVITQNIDNLHQDAGNKTVFEFHGNSKKLICTNCEKKFGVGDVDMNKLPVSCPSCVSLVKPDFIFFGEGIPEEAYANSSKAAVQCEVMLVVGTTAEVMPAGQMPLLAKSTGATIIEINPEPSMITEAATDIFLQGEAGIVLKELSELVL